MGSFETIPTNKHVLVCGMTGTGKSFIILQLSFDYRDKKSIVLAPTNEILDRLTIIAPRSITNCNFYNNN